MYFGELIPLNIHISVNKCQAKPCFRVKTDQHNLFCRKSDDIRQAHIKLLWTFYGIGNDFLLKIWNFCLFLTYFEDKIKLCWEKFSATTAAVR